MARSSYRNARSRPVARSSAVWARVIPIDEPSRAGLTISRGSGGLAALLNPSSRPSTLASMPARQPPPPPIEVDEHLAHVEPGGRKGLGDSRPRDDRDVVLRRRAAEEHDHRRPDPRRLGHAAAPGHGQPPQSPRNTISG